MQRENLGQDSTSGQALRKPGMINCCIQNLHLLHDNHNVIKHHHQHDNNNDNVMISMIMMVVVVVMVMIRVVVVVMMVVFTWPGPSPGGGWWPATSSSGKGRHLTFEDTFENTPCRKVKQLPPYLVAEVDIWIWPKNKILTSNLELLAFPSGYLT